jgi:tetratricopeptide (TPR) repeat protein
VSRVGGTLREGLGEPRLSEEQSAAVRAALPLDPGAARLYVEGLEKLRSYDATSARDLLTKAVEAEPTSPLAHTALAQAWSQLGYDQRAVEEAQRAFDMSAGLPREQRLSIEARLAQTQKKWDEASTLYQTLWKSFPDEVEYGLRLAQAQVAGGHAREALATLDSLRRQPSPQGEDPRFDLAEADGAGAVSDYPRQKAAAARAASKAQRLGARMILAQARIEEGSATESLEDSASAKPKYEEARALYHQAGDRRGEASALRLLGGVRLGAGDNAAARVIYQQAWETFREIGDRRGEAAALTDIINLDWLQAGNLPLVASELEQLRTLYQDIGDQAGIAWALNGMGTVAWIGVISNARWNFTNRRWRFVARSTSRLGRPGRSNPSGMFFILEETWLRLSERTRKPWQSGRQCRTRAAGRGPSTPFPACCSTWVTSSKRRRPRKRPWPSSRSLARTKLVRQRPFLWPMC